MKEIEAKPTGKAYRVTITETLRREVIVYDTELKQPTADDAVQTVSDWWHQGQIILDAEDFTNVDFSAYEVEEGEREKAGVDEDGK